MIKIQNFKMILNDQKEKKNYYLNNLNYLKLNFKRNLNNFNKNPKLILIVYRRK